MKRIPRYPLLAVSRSSAFVQRWRFRRAIARIQRMDSPDIPAGEFTAAGHRAIDLAARLFAEMREQPAFPARQPSVLEMLFDDPVPEHGESLSAILDDWSARIVPNSSLLGHPRWFGFVNGSGSQVGVIAEALAATLNPNLGGWRASPAATEIERRTIRWLAELIEYDPECGGLFLSGGTMANVSALRVALQAKATWNIHEEGLQSPYRRGRFTVYMADHETHVSLVRAVELLGLGRASLRRAPSRDDFTIDTAALERMIRNDREAGMTPFCIVAHAGSINVGAIDDIDELANIAERQSVWLHVDGACGALGAMLPELQARFAGMERADSVSFDAHKWLGVPYEAGCLLVRDAEIMRRTFVMEATYLLSSQESAYNGQNYFDYGPQLSRGWRALKVWMTLRHYGAEGMRKFFRQTIECAQHLHALVESADEFEVVQPRPELYIYSFRFAPPGLRDDDELLDDLNQRLTDEVQRRQIAFAMTTRIRGRVTQRFSICSHRTTTSDIDEVFAAMRDVGRQIVATR